MSESTQPTTLRHKVGTCPACRDYLWAEVDVVALVDTPTIDVEGKAHVYARPQLNGMRVEHACVRDEETGSFVSAVFAANKRAFAEELTQYVVGADPKDFS